MKAKGELIPQAGLRTLSPGLSLYWSVSSLGVLGGDANLVLL